jgi:hypothetical protein
LAVILAGQQRARPLAEIGRPHAHVDRDIEDLALENIDQLALIVRVLQMQAAQDPARRARQVVLHEIQLDAGRGVALFVPGFEKIAARIAEALGLDEQDLGQAHAA